MKSPFEALAAKLREEIAELEQRVTASVNDHIDYATRVGRIQAFKRSLEHLAEVETAFHLGRENFKGDDNDGLEEMPDAEAEVKPPPKKKLQLPQARRWGSTQ
jgi:hypothetical protein